MTFDEIVSTTMTRLNLTSTEAQTRIGVYVNERYKQVTSSIGLITSRRATETIIVDPLDTISFPDLPQLTIDDMEKVNKVSLIGPLGDGVGVRVLKQLTYDEITSYGTLNGVPHAWAPYRMGSGEVTIILNAVTTDTDFTLTFEGYDIAETLSGNANPFIPTDFHDILVEGAKSDELMKMEKPSLAAISEQKFVSRLSDLRMFIAKSAYLDIIQGKDTPFQTWYRDGFMRVYGGF